MESTIGGKSRLVKTIDTLIAVIAAALGIYHFLAARLTIVSSYRHIMIHFLGCFLILFLTTLRIPAANTKSKFKNILCVICAVAILADTIFIYAHHDQYLECRFAIPPTSPAASGDHPVKTVTSLIFRNPSPA